VIAIGGFIDSSRPPAKANVIAFALSVRYGLYNDRRLSVIGLHH